MAFSERRWRPSKLAHWRPRRQRPRCSSESALTTVNERQRIGVGRIMAPYEVPLTKEQTDEFAIGLGVKF